MSKKLEIDIDRSDGQPIFVSEGEQVPWHTGLGIIKEALGLTQEQLAHEMNYENRGCVSRFLTSSNESPIPAKQMILLSHLMRTHRKKQIKFNIEE